MPKNDLKSTRSAISPIDRLARLSWGILFALLWLVLAVSRSALCQDQVRLFAEVGHSDAITSVVFSPDHRWLATASRDDTAKLWETATGRLLATFKDEAEMMSFTADGRSLAIRSGRVVKFRSIASGAVTHSLTVPAGYSLISPYQMVIAESDSVRVRTVDIATGRVLQTFQCPDDLCSPEVFLKDPYRLVIRSRTSLIAWDPLSGKQQTLKQEDGGAGPRILIPSTGATFIRTTWNDPTYRISIMDLRTDKELRSFDDPPLIELHAISPDGRLVLREGPRGRFGLMSTVTGEHHDLPNGGSLAAGDFFFSGTFAFSADGKLLACGGSDRSLRIWDLESNTSERDIQSSASAIQTAVFSPDGKTLATGNRHSLVQFWDLKEGAKSSSLSEQEGSIMSLAYSKDGGSLASATNLNALSVWDVGHGSKRVSLVSDWTWGLFSSVAYSRDGRLLAGAYQIMPDRTEREYGTTYVWSADTGKTLQIIDDNGDTIRSVAFSPDDKILATGGDTVVRFWDPKTGDLIRTLENHAQVNAIAFSTDGKRLAAGSSASVSVWDLATRERRTLSTQSNTAINAVAFSPDGRHLAAATAAGTVEIWDVPSGRVVHTLRGHTGSVETVAFSPDGSYLLSGGDDGTVKLWRPDSSGAIVTLISLADDHWLVTTPDGRFDTDERLDEMTGAHWVLNDNILNPLSLELFMRQYYEPDLLRRSLECNKADNCSKEFKPLPPIGKIKRTQPGVAVRTGDLK